MIGTKMYGNLLSTVKTPAAVKHVVPAEPQGQGGKGQRRRGKLRPCRDLHDAGPAQLRDRARRFPPNQSGWPMFFALTSSFPRETEFTKFVSEEIATVRARHTSRRHRIPMLAARAIVRAVTATKQEPGLSPLCG